MKAAEEELRQRRDEKNRNNQEGEQAERRLKINGRENKTKVRESTEDDIAERNADERKLINSRIKYTKEKN